MEEKLLRPICGEPTRVYMGNARKDKLCGKHADLLKNGKIELKENGFYYDVDSKLQLNGKGESFDNVTKKDSECIVCGKKAPNGYLCRDCYYEMKDHLDGTFDKNSKVFELKDYYFNLKQNIFRMKNFDYVKSNCNKLYALAQLVDNVYKDSSLIDRVVNDIKGLIEIKKLKEETIQKPSEESNTKDERKEELLRTEDGHYVKSHPETIIDDILYEARIVHCYEKKVPIDIDESALVCDWFIPVLDSKRGIYIEYWGMNTKDYLANKERKRKLYKEHNIPLIEI